MGRHKKEFNTAPLKEIEKVPMNLNCILMTKMSKKDKTVLITFKNMILTVVEITDGKEKVKERVKYLLGDIGRSKYTMRVREYAFKGYNIDGQTSNMDEMIKDMKKKVKTDDSKL